MLVEFYLRFLFCYNFYITWPCSVAYTYDLSILLYIARLSIYVYIIPAQSSLSLRAFSRIWLYYYYYYFLYDVSNLRRVSGGITSCLFLMLTYLRCGAMFIVLCRSSRYGCAVWQNVVGHGGYGVARFPYVRHCAVRTCDWMIRSIVIVWSDSWKSWVKALATRYCSRYWWNGDIWWDYRRDLATSHWFRGLGVASKQASRQAGRQLSCSEDGVAARAISLFLTRALLSFPPSPPLPISPSSSYVPLRASLPLPRNNHERVGRVHSPCEGRLADLGASLPRSGECARRCAPTAPKFYLPHLVLVQSNIQPE